MDRKEDTSISIPPDRTSGIQWLWVIKIAGGILSFLVAAFILGRTLVIRPSKPEFTLQDVTLYYFNISVDPSLSLSSKFQVTTSSYNPNARFGMYYDTLVGYGMYHNQQVTAGTGIPAGTYQGHRSSAVWSVLISGTSVPIAPSIWEGLRRDWSNQMVAIVITLEGQVRWKLGGLAKGEYHITVRCPAYLTFWAHPPAFSSGINAIKYQLMQSCNVDFSR